MKKLMGFNFPGDFNLTNSPIRLESNQQIITDLSDLVSSSPLDNDNLLLFVELLVNRFDWIGADLEDIDKCKNVVLDLVSLDGSCVDWLVKRLITNFKSSNKKHLKVDLCSREFESIHELKKHVRTILTTSKDDEELKGDNHKLLYELLGYHSSVQLKERVVAIFPSTHKNPAFKGLRCFFYRDKSGSVDFFSYARCCDNVKTRGQILREHLCDLLVDICKLSPSTLGSISDTLDILYPHHNVQIEHHISFTKAMLYIANRLPMIRTSLYRILINKLTVIDSEIRLADPNVVDVEKVENLRSEKLKELANQLLKGQSNSTQFKKSEDPNWFRDIYDKLRTEEDCDDMSQKLDFLMALVFEDLHLLLNMCNKYTSASINNTNSTGISNPKSNLQQQPMQINGTFKSKNSQDSFLVTLDTQSGSSQHNITRNLLLILVTSS
uniref:Uncharacterized protein n=1 Tax=Theileria annulata TaxID=5874 RepID=A0A3B0MXU0_THEAN